MDEILYLEADEEITSVVDKLKGLESKSVGLVAPKGATIVQSLVSLKLLKKQAEELGKDIVVVTQDEVGQNLANRVGLLVYKDVKSKTPFEPANQSAPVEKKIEIDMTKPEAEKESSVAKPAKQEKEDLPDEFEIHRYDEQEEAEIVEAAPVAAAVAEAAEAKSEPEPAAAAEPAPAPKEEKKMDSNFVHRPVSNKEAVNRHALEAERPMSQHYNAIKPSKPSKKRTGLIFAISFVGFLIIAVFADLVFAKVQVQLSIPSEEFKKDVEVTAEKDRPSADLEHGIIPAKQIQNQKSYEKSIDASGQKDVGTQAKGTLSFKNNDGNDQTVSAGTTVKSNSGIEFTLDSTITVPKAQVNMGQITLGKINGNVTAKDTGNAPNLSGSTVYSILGKSSLSADGGTSGGTTKTVKVVTKADISRGQQDLKDMAQKELSVPSADDKDYIFLEGASSMELNNYTTSKNANDEATSFTAKGDLKYTVLAFKNEDFRAAVTKLAEKDLPSGKSLLIGEGDSITPTLKEARINIGSLLLNGAISSHIGAKIDITSLAKNWKFKPLKNIRNDLSKIEGAQVIDVGISPKYALPLGPVRTSGYDVKIDYSKK